MANNGVKDRTLARATRALAGTLQAGLLVTGLTLTTGLARAQAQQAGASDSQLQASVAAALGADTQLKGQQITATVSQGAVTLNGNVQDDSQRIAAEQTAAQVTGVRTINDGISVGSQPASEDQPAGAGQPAAANQAAQATMPPPPPTDAQQQGSGSQSYPQQGGSYPGQYGQYGPQAAPYGQAGPAGPAGQYGGQYGPGQYAQAPPPARPYVPGVSPEKQNTAGPVTLNPGLLLSVRTSEPLSTARLKAGDFVQFTSASDTYQNGVVAIPRGATLTGQVVESKNAGAFGGSPKLDIKLTTLSLGNQTYPLTSEVWSNQGPSKSGYTATNTVGGAAFGAIIGALAGGGVGAGIGAVAGGATGAAVSGATHGPQVYLPAEALLQFHLSAPLTVQPVSYNEAERLAASVPQQPVLRTRPAYAVAPYPYYARPYYAYPAPYYYGRPY